MAALDDLVDRIEDAGLRESIKREIKNALKHKKFGLVFENLLPECTPLYDIAIKKGSLVAKRDVKIDEIFTVQKIEEGKAICRKKTSEEERTFDIDELVSVAEFGEPIYPYLKKMDSICNAPESSLWHTLIEADNFHALQLLQYMYAGKVDCIYIDPPYNTGARDWKYNNDFVDASDTYRHSKWLSFMERRLKLSKKLLNPNRSVLIVTIDEKEYLHLGCLLEQLFPEAYIQMISSVINPSGSSRQSYFSRSDEYIFYVFIGSAGVVKGQNDMLHPVETKDVRWDGLIRRGANGMRSARPNLFYPLFFSKEDGSFKGVGEPLKLDTDRHTVSPPEGCFIEFPLSQNGDEARWGISPSKFNDKLSKGYIKFGPWRKGSEYRAVYHLQDGTISAIEKGDVEILGKDSDGSLIIGSVNKPVTPMTTWVQKNHSAGDFGSTMLKKIFHDIRFNFPKSLYAVEDALRFVVGDNPNALVLDFFAGSGTTLHAINLLNEEDNGNRRCIMVTNNEVSESENKRLRELGLSPGDPEWEKLGIANYVTWPRTICSIKGLDINGEPLSGEYNSNGRQLSEGFHSNAIFFKLGFLDKNMVAFGHQFKELLPMLWMKSGCIGPCPVIKEQDIPRMMILPENGFAVLFDESSCTRFVDKISSEPRIKTVFIVTDSDTGYKSVVSKMNKKMQTFQLYRDYLENFSINEWA